MSYNKKQIELSSTQKGMYFDCQIGDPVAYNLSAAVLFEHLNSEYFKQALKLLVAEQEALRCGLQIVDDFPVLIIHDEISVHLEQEDLSKEPLVQQEQISLLIEKNLITPFDLTQAPLFRAKLVTLSANKHLLLLCAHHLIADGISFNILIKKILQYHNQLAKKEAIVLTKDTGFLRFIEEERSNLLQDKYAQQKEFWLNKMQALTPLRLSGDSSIKSQMGLGKEKRFALDSHVIQGINDLASEQEISIFILFLAAFSVLMNRYTHSEDLAFSSPFSYRPDFDLEESVGCFIRMLTLRFQIKDNDTFTSILKQAAKEFIDGYKNIEYPNNLISSDPALANSTQLSSVFDVIFVYDEYEMLLEEGVSAEIIPQDVVTFPGSLMVVLNKMPDEYSLKFQYKPDVFDEETIELLGTGFIHLLNLIIANHHIQIKELNLDLNKKKATSDQVNVEHASNEIPDERGIETSPKSDVVTTITAIWKDVLALDEVGLDQNFFDLGGHSFSLIQVNNKLKQAHLILPVRVQFQLPTIRLLANHFSKNTTEIPVPVTRTFEPVVRKNIYQDIAIIGLSINVPGAQSNDAFWHNLKNGHESIHFYEDDELKEMGVTTEKLNSPNYVKASGHIEGVEYFDPAFFDYTPADIRLMSPQYRVLYPGLWAAFEDAGYFPNSTQATIGLYLSGSDDFEWYQDAIVNQHNYSQKYQAFTLSTNHFLATRLAYKLDIKGPVFTVLSGCSSTLVTTHLACQSLMLGECDLAVSGGITVELPDKGGYFYEEGMMFSPDGHCRPFDAKAEGTFFSHGMGLVVLKRLEDALNDGDQIYAVIKGSAVNNDGAQKLGFTAPSVQGQVDAIQKAYRVARIDPETVSYVEAHGTGTALGDPIELESLTQAFASSKKHFCVLGSVKGNVGHPDTASGAVSLVKVALSLKHQYIPGTVNFQTPNPKMTLADSPFIIQSQGMEWNNKGNPRRAGINSFGVGGTNVHMVLEEGLVEKKVSKALKNNLLIFSAKSLSALQNTVEQILNVLHKNPEINKSDAAWTLQAGRKPFSFRTSLVVNDKVLQQTNDVLIKTLKEAFTYQVKNENRAVFFMFSGQGSQYQGMARGLYYSQEQQGLSTLFKKHFDKVICCLPAVEAEQFLDLIFGEQEPQKINETEFSQLALFLLEYSLAQTLIEIGIKPQGMLGHSIGEITAAAVAGVFELKDAVELVRARGRIMQKQKPGTMLAVLGEVNFVREQLNPGLWLALDNTSNSCVVGGDDEAILAFEKTCDALDLVTARVKTSHAFHTPMMDEAAREFGEYIRQFKLQEPRIPLLSNISGTWATAKDISSGNYWAQHIVNPVHFSQCLAEILKNEDGVFVEVGPGHILTSFAKQHASRTTAQHFINMIRHPKEQVDDEVYLNEKIGQLWCAGLNIDWQVVKGDAYRRRISLPTYVFDKTWFPIELKNNSQHMVARTTEQSALNCAATTAKISYPLTVKNDQIVHNIVDAFQEILGFNALDSHQDFFVLGGDSLKAISLVSLINRFSSIKIDVKDIFKYSTPEALADYLKENAPAVYHSPVVITPAPVQEYYPLSSAQLRMYTLYLLDKHSVVYNLPSATLIKGELKYERFEQALKQLVLRHESLRTRFKIIANKPVQMIAPTMEFSLTCSSIEQQDLDQRIHAFIKPFDLEQGPLFRVELIQLNAQEHLFLFDIHHIVADGTSMEIISRDFNTLYWNELPPLSTQYKDFAVWKHNRLSAEPVNAHQQFWLNYLQGELQPLLVPTDFARPAIRQSAGHRIYFSLDKGLTKNIIQCSQQSGSTLFMTLLSAWTILLARYSGQSDIIVGVPVAGRMHQEIEETVGMFVNILPIRNQLSSPMVFSEFLAHVKANVLHAFTHQDYQFNDLVQQLNLKRDLSRNPLFDVCFDFQNMAFHDLNIDELQFTPYSFATNSSAYDLVLTCQENKAGEVIQGFIDYSTSLFKPETIERLIANFQTLLAELTEYKDIFIDSVNILSVKEKMLIEQLGNNTIQPIDEHMLIHHLFEQNAALVPDKIALILADGTQLTYAELNEKANALAWHLLKSGVKNDTIIGVLTQRDASLFIAMLGILKAGAGFLLIDPSLPQERIKQVLTQSDLKILICSGQYNDKEFFNGVVIHLDSCEPADAGQKNPISNISQKNLAYVMFTSGSTGKPKGVMINHESVVNFIQDIKHRELFQNQSDRIIAVTTVSFDIFMFESLVPLCTGHSIYLANELEQLDPALASRKILEHKVTHILSTVSRIKSFTEHAEFKAALIQLQCILSGGEPFPLPLLKRLQQHAHLKIYNMYGPTETTIWSTSKELTQAHNINIGRPVSNTRAYIINAAGSLQPIGVFGELCITGLGVARGYLNDKQESNNKFVPFAENTIAYKTGDRARWLDNGELELQGRLDAQIKVRGYRVELSELEQIALEHEAISQAVALAFDKNDTKHLALYYCVRSEGVQHEPFRKWLKERIPHYMIPAHFILLNEMPVLPNGKIDKNALPLPKIDSSDVPHLQPKAASEMECLLLSLWQEVLCTDEIGLQEHFFDLGGHSLGLIEISNKLSLALGYSVPLIDLFQYSTIEALAQHLGAANPVSQEHHTVTNGVEKGQMDIAVIGIAGRFPGAANTDEFWNNIAAGVDSITHFDASELLNSGISAELLANPAYVNAKGFLEQAEYFDAEFFDYSNHEANLMDPQLRVLHQSAWEVLENAGYNPFNYEGMIGLFAGGGSNVLWLSHLVKNHQDFLNAFEAITLNERDFLTTRLSYKLNLTGPSLNVQTACSTSLVAIHQAVQSLINGECQMAIAGGVSISYPRKEGYLWHEGLIFSRDGQCKPFSEESSGIVPGNGCGLVLLKPLATALQDKDHIYAVIKGSAINNDGVDKIGYTAPSIKGQCAVIKKAMEKSGLDVEQINYLEAHGTGTKLGDPIEIEALKRAWGTDKKKFTALGSVKANIGHLDSAAGVASFIKTVLVLHKRALPPLAHYQNANPLIDFENSPFYINTSVEHITDSKQILRAGVSSFGIGGTNAHVVLEQAPVTEQHEILDEINILLFSARTEEALLNNCTNILKYIQSNPNLNLSNVAWTLQVGRKAFEYRNALVVCGELTQENVHTALNNVARKIAKTKKSLVFCFSAMDLLAQEMIGDELYSSSNNNLRSLFKDHLDKVLKVGSVTERTPCEHKGLTQFAISYSLAKSFIDIGVIPRALMGEGIGELLALVLAEVLTLADAIDLIKNHYDFIHAQKTGVIVERVNTTWSQYKQQEPKIPFLCKNDLDENKKEKMIFIELGRHEISTLLHFNKALAELWCQGVEINWKNVHEHRAKKRVPLPSYAFAKHYYNNDVVLESSRSVPQLIEAPKQKETLATLWSELFGCDEIQPEDDFFALGGDSLRAIMLVAQIKKSFGVDIHLADIFSNSVFYQMEQWLSTHKQEQVFKQIPSLEKRSHYPTSAAQRRMYAMHALLDDALPYNLAAVYTIEGSLDLDKFKDVFEQLVRRHEAFRTRFDLIDGEVVQIIDDEAPLPIEFEEYKGPQLQNKIAAYLRPFDLSKAPLLRIKLIKISNTHHVLLIDMHHIIADQSSISILLREFTSLYSGKKVTELPLHYKEFAAWQNDWFAQNTGSPQLEYWINEFHGELPVLNLQTDFPRPAVRQYEGRRLSLVLDKELSDKLDQCAKQHALTPYMLFMATLSLVLSKYTGQNDLVLGTATAGRRHADLFSIVGMFVNTLAIRIQLNESWSVEQYLGYIKEKMIKAYEHQDSPFELLIEALKLERDPSRNPLFDVVINYIDMGENELVLDDLSITPYENIPVHSKFDLTWTIEKKTQGYTTDLEFNSSLYTHQTIQNLGKRLLYVLSCLLDNAHQQLNDLSLIAPAERMHLLYELNQTQTDYPKTKSIVQLFEEQVEQRAERTAIIWQGKQLSYLDLNLNANKIANMLFLRSVKPGDKIAILLNNSPLQIECILGILKCACIYVPIDPKYPQARIQFMLNDCAAKFLLTQTNIELSGIDVPHILLDTDQEFLNLSTVSPNIAYHAEPLDIAYIMYTSGSTGKPKGVLTSHRNVIRLIKNTNFVQVSADDKFLLISNFAFDGSVFDIFGALLNGASLVMLSEQQVREMSALIEVIKQEHVTLFYIPTALFNLLVEWDVTALDAVRKVFFGGEAASIAHVRKAFDYLGPNRLVNVYGPTEATVFSTYYEVNAMEEHYTGLPIGLPLSNTKLYLLDKNGQLLPEQVVGELYIGGDGVAQGYLNRPQLTNTHFLTNPFEAQGSIYRTGDLVQRLSTGELSFIGRIDTQVKIRGFRVELGEIETHIKKISGIKNAIVVMKQDSNGADYIAAYYTINASVAASEINPRYLKELLRKQLPEYMLPTRMMQMPVLALNANGKIDTKVLPIIAEVNQDKLASTQSENVIEQTIVQQMRKVLDLSTFTNIDDFFSCGGHSIKAITLVHALGQLGINLKVSEVFQHPTAKKLAELCELNALGHKNMQSESSFENKEEQRCIVLNEKQINGFMEHIQFTWVVISEMLCSSELRTHFSFSPVQLLHSRLGSRFSGFTTKIGGAITENMLRKVLMNVVKNNQLLHSVARMEDWYVYDIKPIAHLIEKNIPYIDLSIYEQSTQELILDKLNRSLVYTQYLSGNLPWRCCCLRLDQDTHYIIWSFDHIAFDGRSAEILRSQIEQLVYHSIDNPGLLPIPQHYSDYVSILKIGPESSTEQSIIDSFSLQAWAKNNALIMKRFIKHKGQKQEAITLKYSLTEFDIQEPWNFAFDLTVQLLAQLLGMSNIPLGLVHYGRSYHGEEYYNCVGEFLDIMPVLVTNTDRELTVTSLVEHSRKQAINFMALLFDPDLKEAFPKIAELLLPAFEPREQLLQFILFNFQGFVTKDNKNMFESLSNKGENYHLAKCSITANYDEEHLNIRFSLPESELKLLKKRYRTFKMQEVVDV